VHAYTVNTNNKGCFIRLSRNLDGRVILKQLSDRFLSDPVASFPPGRLVVGRVKVVRKMGDKTMIDVDMRESVLLEEKDKIRLKDIEVGNKYNGTVTRVEDYGVFVRIDNSDLSGLAHVSECSDDYIKSIKRLYDPGDNVKVLVLKVEKERRRIGLSLKASHFEDESDSDDDDSSSASEDSAGESKDEEMQDAVVSDDNSGTDIDSDDENYATKLAAKLASSKEEKGNDGSDADSDSDADDSSSGSDSDSDSESEDDEEKESRAMDADVGFDWGTKKQASSGKGGSDDKDSDSDGSESDDEEIDNAGKSSHKARKKAAAKRQEEKEISLRESALADGTADENPETAADFERLLAGDPNSAENWIKYMAYHLSLADIDSARNVANRAFNRIQFREEGEKLNVWTALLTLELKYGTQNSLDETMLRACECNNQKQVYLRVCEMLEKEVDSSANQGMGQAHDAAAARANDMFAKMCKKFNDKKTVWIAYLKYLLKSSRHEQSHAVLKQSLTNLPDYKHVQTMTAFAQLEYEHGSNERARTIFDTLIDKTPNKTAMLMVYIDKEVKYGELKAARAIFESVIHRVEARELKYSDKQMKGLFRKWYKIEEQHGDQQSREKVKSAAQDYVQRSTNRN